MVFGKESELSNDSNQTGGISLLEDNRRLHKSGRSNEFCHLKEGADYHHEEDELFEIIEDILEKFRKKPSGFGGRFDSDASIAVHEYLKINPVIASDRGFWRWLSFVDGIYKHIHFRYSKPGSDSLVVPRHYYGMGRVHESMFGYLWLRANCVYDHDREDPYEIARIGNVVDLWLSHIIRVDYGSIPAMARAFIRFCEVEKKLSILRTRSLAKEVLRRSSTRVMEIMTEDECFDFLEELWREKKKWNIKLEA